MTLLCCPTCGECKLDRVDDQYHCPRCGAVFSEEQKADIEAKIAEAIAHGVEADIGKLRYRLSDALSAEYPSPEEIVGKCDAILDILPEDPVAALVRAFYRRRNHRKEYHEVLGGSAKLSAYQKEIVYPCIIDLCEHIDAPLVNSFLIAQGDEEALSRVKKALAQRDLETDLFANVKRDAFICHAHADMERIKPILDRLEEEHYFRFWYSERNMPKDVENYKTNIRNAIAKCDVFIVFASSLSMASADVQWELDIADELKKKKRIEYRLEDRNNSYRFKEFFDGVQWIDAAKEENIESLGKRIYSLLRLGDQEEKSLRDKLEKEFQEKLQAERDRLGREVNEEKQRLAREAEERKKQEEAKAEKQRLEREFEQAKRQQENKTASQHTPISKSPEGDGLNRSKGLEKKAEQLSEFVIEESELKKYNGHDSKVVIPEGITSIGVGAFMENANILSVSLPSAVTTIDNVAFCKCSSLKEARFPESLSTINSGAFADCKSLISVDIPADPVRANVHPSNQPTKKYGVISDNGENCIGGVAFRGCTALKSVKIGNGIEAIGDGAFENCNSLASISIGSGVTYIGEHAFRNCSSLVAFSVDPLNQSFAVEDGVLFDKAKTTLIQCPPGKSGSYEIPKSVMWIKPDAFENCKSLTSVSVPASVHRIGEGAFRGCSGELKMEANPEDYPDDFAKAVEYFGGKLPEDAIAYLSQDEFLKDAVIEKDVLKKYKGTMANVFIPKSINKIGSSAFEGCRSLVSVIIPRYVGAIGSSAFAKCKSLKRVSITWASTIEDRAFEMCESLESVALPKGMTTIGERAFLGCSALSSINLPESMWEIGNNAFEDCSALKVLQIPDILGKLGEKAFCHCECELRLGFKLSEKLSKYGPSWLSGFKGTTYDKDGTLSPINTFLQHASFDHKAKTIIWYDRKEENVIIPQGIVTKIGRHAFSGYENLQSIVIPEGVTSIGEGAFSHCSSLKSVVIPEGVISIEDEAFEGCKNLESVSLPSTLTLLGRNAFGDCSSLKSIEIPGSVKEIRHGAFSFCKGLAEAKLNEGISKICESAFGCCESLKSIVIPASVLVIETGAFAYCDGLESLVVDRNNQNYDSSGNCNAIIQTSTNRLLAGCKTTVIPSAVEEIEEQAFSGCQLSEDFTIPPSVKSIRSHAFKGAKFKTLTIPRTVTKIGKWAFDSCYFCHLIIPAKGVFGYPKGYDKQFLDGFFGQVSKS